MGYSACDGCPVIVERSAVWIRLSGVVNCNVCLLYEVFLQVSFVICAIHVRPRKHSCVQRLLHCSFQAGTEG
jgi:hypothetical protein